MSHGHTVSSRTKGSIGPFFQTGSKDQRRSAPQPVGWGDSGPQAPPARLFLVPFLGVTQPQSTTPGVAKGNVLSISQYKRSMFILSPCT